jgi:predicted RNase H-like nuclease (RuvC/YqgF family)
VTADNEDGTQKTKERPLAARRNLVKKVIIEGESTKDTVSEVDNDTTGDRTSNKEQEGSENSETPSSSAAAEKAAKLKITSERTRDIEKEIAKNTASFDEKMTALKEKVGAADATQVVVKKKVLKVTKKPMEPFQVMRFFRLLAIIVLG